MGFLAGVNVIDTGAATHHARRKTLRVATKPLFTTWQRFPTGPAYVSITADKIVNGKATIRGTLEFRYNSDRRTSMCENAHGVWFFSVDGGKMQGTLALPDNTLFRRVMLRKQRKPGSHAVRTIQIRVESHAN